MESFTLCLPPLFLSMIGYIGEFEYVDDHRSGKIVVELNGRLNKCGVISPRFDIGVKEIEGWTARLLPSRQVSPTTESFGFDFVLRIFEALKQDKLFEALVQGTQIYMVFLSLISFRFFAIMLTGYYQNIAVWLHCIDNFCWHHGS